MRAPALWLMVLITVSAGPSAFAEEPPAADSPSSLTLADCYALALKRSETVAIQRELITQTEGQFLQALSGALPNVSYNISQTRQDGTGSSNFSLRDIPERKFTLSQPLFSGFKEFAAIAGAGAERRQRKQERARAEQLLLGDVSDAFYLVLEQREDLATLEATRSALMQRIDDLQDREKLGRSRPSEVASAEAQLRRTEAELELVRGKETTARQLLEFLTGLPQLQALNDEGLELGTPDAEAAYTTLVDQRPDVQAKEAAWRVARDVVWGAQATLWPDVDLESNYYTKRAGNAADIDWDVILKVSIPLFQGGDAVGSVKETRSLARQAKLDYERTKREALLEIRETHAKLSAELTRLHALQHALEAAEEDYRLQQEDYRLSLVNNLEVLRALEALQESRRDVLGSRYAAKRLYWQLRTSTGRAG